MSCVPWVTPGALAGYTVVDLYTIVEKPSSPLSLYTNTGEVAARGQLTLGAGVYLASGAFVNLTPTMISGFGWTLANATNGAQQVGRGAATAYATNAHALMWSGKAESAVDLHPAFLGPSDGSAAFATNGTQQVGSGGHYLNEHALIWNGSAESAVDLHPAGYYSSAALGTDGTHQVGSGRAMSDNTPHALLWTGTADSAIDLNPTQFGYAGSFAESVSGNQQVGYAQASFQGWLRRAVLWTGTADSAVDLSPTAVLGRFQSSQARGTNGRQQVGYASVSSLPEAPEAMIWSGTADSAVNLNALLPSGFLYSDAYSIDNAGNVFGVATDSSGSTHAIEWAVPEPGVPLVVVVATGLLHRTRRRKWRATE